METAKSFSSIFMLFLLITLFSLVGCSAGTNSSVTGDFGRVTGVYADAANSTIIAESEVGEYVIPVAADGRFSAGLPAGVYTFSYRSATSGEKLKLTNRTFVVANNMTISIIDASLIPQPKVLAVNVSVVNTDSAIIEWETDIESDGYLEYGTNELYGYMTYVSTEMTKMHRVQLGALNIGTTYHFRIVASRHNSEAAQTITKDYTFTTES